jgi:hypothetical protein
MVMFEAHLGPWTFGVCQGVSGYCLSDCLCLSLPPVG